jgi:hypothetical protein
MNIFDHLSDETFIAEETYDRAGLFWHIAIRCFDPVVEAVRPSGTASHG